MDKKLLILLATGVVIVGLAIFTGSRGQNKPLTPENNLLPALNTAERQLETKTDDQAGVTVTVTPTDISPQSKEWKFNVIMSTHSVELDQDMAKTSFLVDDQAKEYRPLRWEGAPPGGHHREGILVFEPTMPYPQSLTLIIENIGDVERRLSWDTFEGSYGNN